MRLLPFHFSAKRSKLETWNVQIFSALTGTSQQLSPTLPILKDTWPLGELCDRKTFPPCTRLLSHCEHSPCFASAICGDFVTNESCEIINIMLFSFCPTVRWLTLRGWRGLGAVLFWTHTRKQSPRYHVSHKILVTIIVNSKTQNIGMNGWRCGGRRSKSHYQKSE